MDEGLALRIKKISEAVDKRLNARAKAYGLTLAQCRVLMYLCDHTNERVTQRDLEEYLGATHATVSGIIRRMKLRGLITTSTDRDDRRAKNLNIREGKEAFVKAADNENITLDSLLTFGFTEDERVRLADLLDRVYKNATDTAARFNARETTK